MGTPGAETIDVNNSTLSLCSDEEAEEEEEWRRVGEHLDAAGVGYLGVRKGDVMVMRRSWRVRHLGGIVSRCWKEREEMREVLTGYERAVADMQTCIERLQEEKVDTESRLHTAIAKHKEELGRMRRVLDDTVAASTAYQQKAAECSVEAGKSQKALRELLEKDCTRLSRGEQLYKSVCSSGSAGVGTVRGVVKKDMKDLISYCEALVHQSDTSLPSACLTVNSYLSSLAAPSSQDAATLSSLLTSLRLAFPAMQSFFADLSAELTHLQAALTHILAPCTPFAHPPIGPSFNSTGRIIACLRQWRDVLA